jgi:hypothetical protein
MAVLRIIRLRLPLSILSMCIHPWRQRTQCMCEESACEMGCIHKFACVCLCVVCMPSACFCESRVIRAALTVCTTLASGKFICLDYFLQSCFVLHLKCNARSLTFSLFISAHLKTIHVIHEHWMLGLLPTTYYTLWYTDVKLELSKMEKKIVNSMYTAAIQYCADKVCIMFIE